MAVSAGHSQYLSPTSRQKIDIGVLSVCILAQMINESIFFFSELGRRGHRAETGKHVAAETEKGS